MDIFEDICRAPAPTVSLGSGSETVTLYPSNAKAIELMPLPLPISKIDVPLVHNSEQAGAFLYILHSF